MPAARVQSSHQSRYWRLSPETLTLSPLNLPQGISREVLPVLLPETLSELSPFVVPTFSASVGLLSPPSSPTWTAAYLSPE